MVSWNSKAPYQSETVDMGLFLCGVWGGSWVEGVFGACKGKQMGGGFWGTWVLNETLAI